MTTAVADVEQLESELTNRFAGDFPYYARNCLTIRTKEAETRPLRFNRSQRFVHDRVEEQRARLGLVRAMILKSRQVGISTYLSGRSYYRTTFGRNVRAFILTHLDDATDNLFGMVKRFHENVPDFVRPRTGASNAKELVFPGLDSGYRVSTAGNKSVGRSHTLQIFHGSEVAFWPNAADHLGGVLQAIPHARGTEVFLESTANGIGNIFHQMWVKAERGENEFIPIFVPWFWHEEYRREAPTGWMPPPEWTEYAETHGLTLGQVFWAFMKNNELAVATSNRAGEICWLFRQEYPATAQEAFQTSGVNSFVPGDAVLRARKRTVVGAGPIVLGVDVARGGDDKSAIVDRQGRRLGGHVCRKVDYGKNIMPLVGEVIRIVREMRISGLNLARIVVDSTGVGGGVHDALHEQLGSDLVMGIEFGGGALQKDRYANRRAEIWDEMRQWFISEAGVGCPDDDDFQQDVCAPAWGTGQMTRFRSDGCLIMEEKPHMKKRLSFSPDYGDAAALTFAVNYDEFMPPMAGAPPFAGQGGWML